MPVARVPLIAGNWKLNKTSTEAYKLVTDMLPGLRNVKGIEKLLCPPFTALMVVSRLIKDTDICLGAQNMYWEEKGSYTGEISPAMVAEYCQYVILGHSERRAYFNETNQQINRKIRAAMAHQLTPILCVGETLDENEAGRAAGVVSRQIREALIGVDILDIDRIVIAYEPVWAIGTGRAATAQTANTLIQNVIRPTLENLFDERIAQIVRILYGGSVGANNAREFFQQPEIDGALVGGASLNAQAFVAIAEAVQT